MRAPKRKRQRKTKERKAKQLSCLSCSKVFIDFIFELTYNIILLALLLISVNKKKCYFKSRKCLMLVNTSSYMQPELIKS